MNLKELVVGALIALSSLGCTTYRVIKRPPKPVPMPTKNITEEIKVPEAPKNYRQIRYASGTYSLYDTTFFTPESKLKEEEKSKEIEERISYISETIAETNILENSKKELDKEKLSSKTLPIDLPKDKKVIINTLEECLNVKETDTNNFYRALCRVASERSGYGIILGEDYVITPASLIYQRLIAKELKRDKRIEISELEELKEKEETVANYANLLAINPLKDLALLEIIDSKKKRYWRIPILKNKIIEDVTVYTDSTLRFLESDAKLKEKELEWRFGTKELKAAEALNFSLITVKTPSIILGSGIYNTKGLVGIIAARPEKDFEKESINTLVVNSNLIREFLEDYINFLRSNSDNLETLTKALPPKETRISEETKSLESKVEKEHKQKSQRKDITNHILIGYLGLVAAAVGKFFYDIYSAKEKPEEEFKPEGDIQARLNELKGWINEQKESIAKEKEAADHIENLQISRIIPPTSENLVSESRKSHVTVDEFEKTAVVLEGNKAKMYREGVDFIKWLEECAKERLKLPKELIAFYGHLNIPYEDKKQKLIEIKKERKTRLAKLEVERIERLKKILELDKLLDKI